MATWETRLSESPLIGNLRKTRDALTGIDPAPAYPDESEPINRCMFCIDQIILQFSSADSRAISESTLGGLEQQSSELSANAIAFRQTRDQVLLLQLIVNVNSLLVLSSQLPPLPWGEAKDVVQQSVESLGDSSDKLRARVRALSTQLNSKISEIEKKLAMESQDSEQTLELLKTVTENQLSELQQSIGDQIQQFQQSANRMQTQIDANIQRIDSAIPTFNDQFRTFQESQTQQFSESQELRQTDFEDFVEQQKQSSTDSANALHIEGEQLIKYLSETAKNAETILGVTAASVTSEAYLNEAKEQKQQADLWRRIAILGLFGAATAGFATFLWMNPAGGSSTSQVISFQIMRTAITGAFVAVAGFAMRESGKHRSRETENKRLANELTTFRPFLSELKEDDRNELVREASSRYFPGHGANGLSSASEPYNRQPSRSEEGLESDGP